MVTEDLIIGIDRFRFFAGVDESVDSNIIAPLIIQATRAISEKILGTALTRKLITEYNDDNLTGIYAELYSSDKASVELMVIWQTFQLGMPRFLYRIGNGQVTKGNSSNGEVATNQDVAFLQKSAEANLLREENSVKKFLSQNRQSIAELSVNTPEFLKPNTREVDSSQGFSSTPNIRYSNF